jgi:putative ABC transport system ATP-binding protein
MTQGELILFRQRHIGFIFQSFNLMPYYTALEKWRCRFLFAGFRAESV